MSDGRKMDARISCTSQVQNTLREFCKGADKNYDDVLRYLCDVLEIDPDGDTTKALLKGVAMRDKIPTYDQRTTKQRTKRNG